jgi:hypothetical protein
MLKNKNLNFGGLLGSSLAQHGLDASNAPTENAEASWVLELAAALLDAQGEDLLLQLTTKLGEIGRQLFANGFDFHGREYRVRRLVRVAADEAAFNAQLRGREAEGFFGERLRNTSDFKQHIARADHGDPKFGRAFSFTHPRFGWASGDWFVREDADEDFAFPL